MASSRSMQDPFLDAPLRSNTSNDPSSRTQHGLRSNASAASSRARQPRELFAPTLTRRPTGRATPNVGDEVFADTDSERELAAQRHRLRQRRRGESREGKRERELSSRVDEVEIVNRGQDGNYLTSVSHVIEAPLQQLMGSDELLEERRQAEMDNTFVEAARQHHTAKLPSGGRARESRRRDEDDEMQADMRDRLREMTMIRLDEDRWRYEPVDPHRPAL